MKKELSRPMKMLRWVLVPISSVVCSIIGYALVVIYCNLQNGLFESYNGTKVTSITNILLYLGCNYFSGLFFVKAGTFTAPEYKGVTAVVLATVYVALCIFSFIYTIITDFSFLEALSMIASGTASIITAKSIYKEQKDF